jgi:hypothetical protein
MKSRKLRIAWSVACGVVAVLLIVLWVRSYLASDRVSYSDPNGYHTTLGSNRGCMYLIHHRWLPGKGPVYHNWARGSGKAKEHSMPFGWTTPRKGATQLVIPYFCLVPAIVTAAFVPWLPGRFSLRTLLIATTLLAVVLGLIAYVAR